MSTVQVPTRSPGSWTAGAEHPATRSRRTACFMPAIKGCGQGRYNQLLSGRLELHPFRDHALPRLELPGGRRSARERMGLLMAAGVVLPGEGHLGAVLRRIAIDEV